MELAGMQFIVPNTHARDLQVDGLDQRAMTCRHQHR